MPHNKGDKAREECGPILIHGAFQDGVLREGIIIDRITQKPRSLCRPRENKAGFK